MYVTLWDMVIAKKLIPLLLVGALVGGCSTTITNLTPKQTHKTPSNLYTLEAAFNSRQQSLRWESLKPQVVIDDKFYPMRLTKLMTNRWETVVPISPGNKIVYYRYKFDFNYNAFGAPPQGDSAMSKKYRLQILDN